MEMQKVSRPSPLIAMIPKRKNLKKASSQDFFVLIFIGALIFGALGFFIFSNFRISRKRAELQDQIQRLQKEIQIAEQKNQELKAGIAETQSEASLEKEAREKLNLKKPGEEVAVVLPAKETVEVQPEKESFWKKLFKRWGF